MMYHPWDQELGTHSGPPGIYRVQKLLWETYSHNKSPGSLEGTDPGLPQGQEAVDIIAHDTVIAFLFSLCHPVTPWWKVMA